MSFYEREAFHQHTLSVWIRFMTTLWSAIIFQPLMLNLDVKLRKKRESMAAVESYIPRAVIQTGGHRFQQYKHQSAQQKSNNAGVIKLANAWL